MINSSLLCQSHYVFMERNVMDNYDDGFLRIAEERLNINFCVRSRILPGQIPASNHP